MRHTPGRSSSTFTGLSTRIRTGLTGFALLGAAVTGLALTAGPAGAASNAPASNTTATTTFHAYPDVGNHGTWADDDFTRVATLAYAGAIADTSDCGPTATTCAQWLGTITDTGTFYAISGASSPQAGVSETGSVSGPFKGSYTVNFYSSGTPSSSGVPANVTGAGPVTALNWVEQFFPSGTTFGTGPTLASRSYAYSSVSTCENWVSSNTNSNGSLATDGDITGVNHCVTSTGEISTFVNHSASCLDNSNETWANGNYEQIWTCGAAGGEDQNFRLAKYNGAQVLQSVAPTTVSDAPWCVTASVATAQLSIQACTGTGGQVIGKQGSVYIFTAIGDAMDLSASNTTNGTPVIAYAQTGGKNQEWSLP